MTGLAAGPKRRRAGGCPGDEGRNDRLYKLGLTGNSIQLDITPLIPRQMRDSLRKLLVIWISGLAVSVVLFI